MPTIYRKSLKGIDELAFKSGRLTLRLTSYLLAVDGASSTEELAARNPHLPSMDVILNGLMQQGFIEAVNAPTGAPSQAQAGYATRPSMAPGGTPAGFGADRRTMSPVTPADFARQAAAAAQAAGAGTPSRPFAAELDMVKGNMVRDVSSLLGSDAAPVINKIQNCATKDDLFAAMMGIKKIITMYVDKETAEKFATRYISLSS
jgi:hypothetical protein